MKVETKYPEVFVEINITNFSYKIIQIINGKNKVRRRVIGRAIRRARKGNPSHDNYGNQLYKRFESIKDAKENALNFVNNFLVLK